MYFKTSVEKISERRTPRFQRTEFNRTATNSHSTPSVLRAREREHMAAGIHKHTALAISLDIWVCHTRIHARILERVKCDGTRAKNLGVCLQYQNYLFDDDNIDQVISTSLGICCNTLPPQFCPDLVPCARKHASAFLLFLCFLCISVYLCYKLQIYSIRRAAPHIKVGILALEFAVTSQPWPRFSWGLLLKA